MQLVLGTYGDLVSGEKDITIELRYPLDEVDDVVMWSKMYEGIEIVDGVLSLTLSGNDDSNRALVVEMFDEEDVELVVDVEGNQVALGLVNQPYAIKSRISDESHSTRGIRGVEVEEVGELSEGDILVVKDGKWVATGETDGYTGLAESLGRNISVSQLSEVNIEGVEAGDILSYNGVSWVNTIDQTLSPAEIDSIVKEQGYITEVSPETVSEGNYDQITGIGGTLEVSPNIVMSDDVEIGGDLKIDGSLGTESEPMEGLYTSSANIGGVEIIESNGNLVIGGSIEIAGQEGRVLTGEGVIGELAVYSNENELTTSTGITYNEFTQQLGIGGQSELSDVLLNVEGILRVSDQLYIGNEALNLSQYIKASDLSAVSFTGQYSDLTGVPDLSGYVTSSEVESTLTGYYTKSEVEGVISNELTTYETTVVASAISTSLEDYDTAAEQAVKLESELDDYYTEDEANAVFVSSGELDTTLGSYVSESYLESSVLPNYPLRSEISQVGYSGSYNDLGDVPTFVLESEFESYKTSVASAYVTQTTLETQLQIGTSNLKEELTEEIEQDYVSKDDISSYDYATNTRVTTLENSLSNVAISGEYTDLNNAPDLSGFVSSSDLESNYVSNTALVTELSGYTASDELSTVALTGQYSDVVGAPDISLYQTVAGMSDYVLEAAFTSEMSDVARVSDIPTFDLSVYATNADVIDWLDNYALESVISEVGYSGNFSDLSGIESVIMEDELSEVLGDYVSESDLLDERANIDEVYYDSDELDVELNALKTEVESDRSAELSSYDKSVTVDAKISAGITTALSSYVLRSELKNVSFTGSYNDLSDSPNLDDYITLTELNESLDVYITEPELDIALQNYIDVSETGSAEIPGNFTAGGEINATGFNGDGSGLSNVIASGVSWNDVTEKSIVNSEVSDSAAIKFSKLDISGSDIRGLNTYSGGTGVSVGSDGVIGIGQEVGVGSSVTFGGLSITGAVSAAGQTITAGYFVGDGSGITNIDASALSDITSEQILDGTIQAVDIGDSAVITAKVADSAITTAKLADGAITTIKLEDSAITTAKLADGDVTTVKVADGAITTTKLADGDVTTVKVADSAITSAKIAVDTIVADDIAGGAVGTSEIEDGAIINEDVNSAAGIAFSKLAISDSDIRGLTPYRAGTGINLSGDGEISMEQSLTSADSPEFENLRVNNTVTASYFVGDGSQIYNIFAANQIVTSSIVGVNIAANAISEVQLASDAVTSGKIADDAVKSRHIEDGAITVDDIGADAVGSSEIINGSILNEDISSGAQIDFSKLNITASDIRGLTSYSGGTGVSVGNDGVIAIGQDVGVGSSVTFGGLSLTGEMSASGQTITAGYFVGDGSGITNIDAGSLSDITSAQILDGTIQEEDIGDSEVTTGKLADGSVTTIKLADGAVTTVKLADGSVTTVKLADSAVTTGKLADGGVTTVKLADGSVTTTKLADDAVTSTKIALDTIVAGDIAVGAVETGEILNGTILNEDISSATQIDFSKLNITAEDLRGSLDIYSGGEGVLIGSDGVIDIGQEVETTSDVTFGGLTVNGDINFTGSISNNGVAVGTFKTNASNEAYYNSGSVLIGKDTGNTNTATAVGTTEANVLEVAGYGTALKWCVYSSNCTWGIGTNTDQLNIFGKGSNGINFEVSGNSNAVIIDSSGNVGIGGSSSGAPLEVRASGSGVPGTNGIYVLNSSTGSNESAVMGLKVSSTSGDPYIGMGIDGALGYSMGVDNDDGDKFKIAANWSDLSSNTRLIIDNAGNVGIGVADPSVKLDVDGIIKGTSYQGDGSGLTGINQSQWEDVTGGINYTGGSVGIGVGSPSEALEINGNLIVGSGAVKTTTGGTFGVHTNGISINDGNTDDLMYVRKRAAGIYDIQTYYGSNSGELNLQTYGGNVGIGLNGNAAGYKLDVNGGIAGAVYYDKDDANYYMDASNTSVVNNLTFNGLTGSTITMSDDLLIEEEAPRMILKETGVDNTPQWYHVADNGTWSLRLNNSIYPIYVGTNSSNDAISDIRFRTGASDAERLRIDDAGNVGIGTTAPSEMLEVAGTVKAQAFVDASGNSKGAFIDTGTTAYYTNGNVGIGTSSPSGVLDIVGSTAVNPGIEITTEDTGNLNIMMKLKGATNTERAIGFYDNETLAWWFGRDNLGDASDGLAFYNGSNSEYTLVIRDSGNVGIGTSNPGAKLEVAGNMIIDGEITKTGITKPSGWGGGLTTFDIYSSATIAVGDSSGTIASYFNNTGKALFGGPLYVGDELGSGETTFSTLNQSNVLAVNGYGTALKWCVYSTDCNYGIGTNNSQLNIFGKNIYGINFEVQNNTSAMVITNEGTVGVGIDPTTTFDIKGQAANLEDGSWGAAGEIPISDWRDTWTRAAFLRFSGQENDFIFHEHYSGGGGSLSYGLQLTPSNKAGGFLFQQSYNGNDRVGLGINTRPEDYALAVGGDINFTGTLYNNGSEFSSSVFSLNGTNAYYSAGNVGIGTTSPTDLLHISAGNSGDAVLVIEADEDNNNETDNPSIVFRQDGSSDWSVIKQGDNQLQFYNSVSSSGGISFYTNNINGWENATEERLLIDSNGNVGIGTTSPSEKLVVDGNVNVNNMISLEGGQSNAEITFYSGTWGDDIYIGGGGSTVIGAGEFALNADTNDTFSGEDLILGADYGIRFFTNSNTYDDKVEAMTIGTNGNVGIGTNSPSQKLHVNGDLKVDGTITATDISGGGLIPSGLISMWSGTIANIPSGWVLCDGTNNTPDLSGRFVVGYSGSGNYSSIGNTGGSDSRALESYNMPSHNHSGSISARDTNHTHSGTSYNNNQSHSHTASNNGDHYHDKIYTSYGYWIQQDDLNNSGGSGYSFQGGRSDNGGLKTSTNGSHNHTIGNNSSEHNHYFQTGSESHSHSHSITIENSGIGIAFDNRPAYYVIAFIMKE